VHPSGGSISLHLRTNEPEKVWGEQGLVARSPSSAYKVMIKAKRMDRFKQMREDRSSHRSRRPGSDRSTIPYGMKPGDFGSAFG